ncbi:hypothetical protein [Paenibacillus dokdonensis]|uniref:hypothetical protein n=1 Tax=Paenibacillus dokdonensis TaxID=2567944 RepID=UPI0010A91B6E|nr:hypothetical protein [Paenibacillus dokdonensis]
MNFDGTGSLKQEDFQFQEDKKEVIPPTWKLTGVFFGIGLIIILNFLYPKLITKDAAVIGFWGSIVSGIISGGMTLVGVLVAFKLEKNQSRKRTFKKISSSFSRFTMHASIFYELSLRISVHTSATTIDKVDQENYKEIENLLANLNIQKIIDEFMAKQEGLDLIQDQLSSMMFIFFTEYQKYWNGIKNIVIGSNKDQKKMNALFTQNKEKFKEIELAARLVCLSILSVNHSEDL